MSAPDAIALLDATRLFLRRHEEALASGDPGRGLEACEGLVEALGETLPRELAGVADATARHAEARAVADRRIAELEGLALQLKLALHQLAEHGPDARARASPERQGGPVDVLRLVALLTATRRQLRALEQALALWAAAHGAPAPSEPPASEALRAAREALAAGCAEAASEALAAAARRVGIAAPARTSDLVEAWRALDELSATIERKAMGR
ncbi:MAG TPA: hypothetical protein VM582_07030 [Candidatus Thermoplasmatota archaeon]|nr:hypothetical protein [Candidatus Thermoplasmatota archaeon]